MGRGRMRRRPWSPTWRRSWVANGGTAVLASCVIAGARAPDRAGAAGRSPAAGSRSRRGGRRSAVPSGFSSTLLPPYARRTRSLNVLLPLLYLRGLRRQLPVGVGGPAGKDAPGLSGIDDLAPEGDVE